MEQGQQYTRLIVSNLPPSLTEDLLKSHVCRCPSEPPRLTDIKILRKPDGTSRRIAFLGFKATAEAERILRWLDGSYVQGISSGARVKVDWAKDTHEAPRPRKRMRGSPPSASTSTEDTANAAQPAKPEDDRFAEFLAVMAPKKNRAVEDQTPFELATATPVRAHDTPVTPILEDVGQHDAAHDPTHVDAFTQPRSPVRKLVGAADSDDDAAQDDTLTDSEYMAKRMKRALDEVDPEEDTDVAQANDHEESQVDSHATHHALELNGRDTRAPTDTESDLRMIQDTGRLFLRNLAFSATEDDVRRLLEPFGALEQVYIPFDRSNQAHKGIAYVTFTSASAAIEAFQALDRRSFQGRLLHILPAAGRRKGSAPNENDPSSIKHQRLQMRKRDAGQALSWGILYMSSDAVMSSIASRLELSKADLLDPTSDNAAVRLALAETHVINETKQYFENEGVNLESLSARGPRSPSTLLVKNIPFSTSNSTLEALFTPFGSVRRLLLPPARTIAIVEMQDAAAAADAWRGLVYKKLGNSVLYLERAAAGIWDVSDVQTDKDARLKAFSREKSGTVAPTGGEAGSTLFIKNLSFATTSASLAVIFDQFPDFLFARVQTKPDPKDSGRTLSMGFGFVGFRTAAAAAVALKSRHHFVLDGHQLEVRFAQRDKEPSNAASLHTRKDGKATSTKLIVKNVPFEVSRKEIRELFSAYGQLKSVRLPRKFDRKTRGFAFLDFASRQDAEAAFQALEHTHLLGRHLVLQWADEEDFDMEVLRAKTGFVDNKVPGQKAKFTFDENV